MRELTPFNFNNNDIRVIQDDNSEVWFIAKDICDVLDFGNHRQALASHVGLEDVHQMDTLTSGGNQQMSYVNESGLYALIFGSNKPEAKVFKKWVTSEVLPSIRKTGAYSKTLPDFSSPADAARAWACQYEAAQLAN